MADLDDFFAKKDKKKSKPKKFSTPEEIAKKLDTTSKKVEQPRKTTTTAVEPQNQKEIEQQPTTIEHQEDEWKDFVEEKKDYSGLKIGQLQINDDEDGSGHGSGQEGYYDEYDSDGDPIVKERKTKGGPWKPVIPAEEVTQIPMEPTEKSTSKLYVIPGIRHTSNSNKPLKIRNKNAPDITNEMNFPTLSAGEEKLKNKKKNEPQFEEVKHGGRIQKVQDIQQKQEAPSVGNRFRSLLTDDDS